MEKKLNDEEIVKALEFKAKFDAKVAYVDGCDCKHIRVADILDLTRSLRQRVSILEADNDDYKMKIAENELVSIDWHNEQVMYLQDENNRLSQKAIELEVETNNQKAEIERLANANMQTIGKNAELLLKVDELIAKLQCPTDITEAVKPFVNEAVKDTAKEILAKANELWLDTINPNCLISKIEQWIKERYGVEVE